MPRDEPPSIRVGDKGTGHIYAAWSRSGKRLIISVWGQTEGSLAQVEFRPEQVEEFATFLRETLPMQGRAQRFTS